MYMNARHKILFLLLGRVQVSRFFFFSAVDIDGLGALDIILELLVQFISAQIKDFMADVIQGPVQLLFNQILLQFPIDPPAP